MNVQETIDYGRIAEAIRFIHAHFKEQPDLEQVAQHVALSPYHLQRMFTEWAGVSPKKFLQYITVEHAKNILAEQQASIFNAAFETGLSGTGRLHDLFVTIEGMTPGEFKNGGVALTINYDFCPTPFGTVLIASTQKGICHLSFADNPDEALNELKANFPAARFYQTMDDLQRPVATFFNSNTENTNNIKLHLKGTAFQLKVWAALLKIPSGKLTTYGSVSSHIEAPGASRAVGTAIGDNPVAFIIPCHRVIRSTGVIGDYRWGTTRKKALIGWEAARGMRSAL